MFAISAGVRSWIAATLAALVLLVAPVGAVDFEFLYDDPAGQGFLHTVQGEARRQALQVAADIWGRLIPPSYAGETITIRIKFQDLDGGLANGAPHYFYSDFGSSNPAYQEDVNYPKALANHLAGRDLAPERHEAEINVDSDTNYYYGTDGMLGAGQFDFISVMAHEIGHSLGYLASFLEDGEYGILGNRGRTEPICPGCLPTPYDLFLTFGGFGPTLISLPDDEARQSALTSGSIFWNGSSAVAANGGMPPKIFAPSTFDETSSISHTDDATFPNTIMISAIGSGQVTQTPTAVERGILRDMGWTITVASSQVNWTGLGADNKASTAANWSPTLPQPGDSLVFDQSPRTDVDMDLFLGTLQGISFPAAAPAYTLRFKSNVDIDLTGTGIINFSPSAQTIFLESPLQDEPTPSLFPSAAALTFKNTANAGNADYRLSGGGTSIGGGPPPHIPHRFDRHAGASVTFENNSTAGTASFEIEGGAGNGGPNAQVTFRHNSRASAAEFRTKGGRLGPDLPLGNVIVGFGGQVLFEDNARAGLATFHNEGQTEYFNGAGGFTVFTDSSTAEGAEIHNHGATFTNLNMNGIGGATFFYDTSTAGASRITNHADGMNHHHSISARTVFQDSSNAGTATIENLGASSQSVRPGRTEFRTSASAANATIHNRAFIQVGDIAGRTDFYDDSTAANATIHTYEGYSDAGRVEFRDGSTAADAHIFVNNVPEIVGSTGNGGHVVFRDNSSAATSDITLRAGACCNGIQFYNNATAADADITTENGSGNITFWGNSTAATANISLGEGSVMYLYDQSTAGDAIITLANRAIVGFAGTSAGRAQIVAAGGSVYTAGSQAYVNFVGTNATAADSTIIVNGATAPLASPASIYIIAGASAGNATLIANGGSNGGEGGSIFFNAAANGSTARLVANAGGVVNFQDQRLYNDISFGSIEGAGTFMLRGAHVIAGSRNTSTTVTGQIIDHPTGFVTGGRLTKVGSGTLTLAGTNTYSGVTTVAGGTLRVDGSIAGDALVQSGATLIGNSGAIGGNLTVNSGGKFSPGASPGTITVGGLTMMPGAFLEFEIGEPLRDHVVVTNNGNISLAGILNISLLDGFVPALGQSFPLFEGAIGAISGVFDTIIAPTFNGLTFDLVQNAGSVLLQVGEATLLPGDFNGDGAINAADYVVWRKNGGAQSEYNTWRANFGRSDSSGSAATGFAGGSDRAVPEPVTAWLAMLGVGGLVSSHRKTRRLRWG